jgi:hypothetical protein
MPNFLTGMLFALLPSLLAVAWLTWRAGGVKEKTHSKFAHKLIGPR